MLLNAYQAKRRNGGQFPSRKHKIDKVCTGRGGWMSLFKFERVPKGPLPMGEEGSWLFTTLFPVRSAVFLSQSVGHFLEGGS